MDASAADGRKSTEWYLEPRYYDGVQSTTRYRKGNSKSARWLNKAAVRQKIYSEGAEQMVKVRLPVGSAKKSPLYDELELLVSLTSIFFGYTITWCHLSARAEA